MQLDSKWDTFGITEADNILVLNIKTGDLIEVEIFELTKQSIVAYVGKTKLKFSRRTGKGQDSFSLVAWGQHQIEDYRRKQGNYPSDEQDRSLFVIPNEKKGCEDGSLLEVADILGMRVRFHIANNDWDGAVRIVEYARSEHFNRIEELRKAALNNGLTAPISLLGLSVRTTNSIEALGCKTIFDLCVRDGGAMQYSSGIGPESYEVIRKRLDEFGFNHRMEPLVVRRKAV